MHIGYETFFSLSLGAGSFELAVCGRFFFGIFGSALTRVAEVDENLCGEY